MFLDLTGSRVLEFSDVGVNIVFFLIGITRVPVVSQILQPNSHPNPKIQKTRETHPHLTTRVLVGSDL